MHMKDETRETELCTGDIKTSNFDTFHPGKGFSRGKNVITSTISYLTLAHTYEISLLNLLCPAGLWGFGKFGNLSNRWIK